MEKINIFIVDIINWMLLLHDYEQNQYIIKNLLHKNIYLTNMEYHCKTIMKVEAMTKHNARICRTIHKDAKRSNVKRNHARKYKRMLHILVHILVHILIQILRVRHPPKRKTVPGDSQIQKEWR